jgi:ArsR family transcriptional regulator
MDMETQGKKATLLKAMGHTVRIEIIELLGKREMCACEIASLFDCDRTTVSKHLAILKDLEIIEQRREGLYIYYRLKLHCLVPMLQCIEHAIFGDPVKIQFDCKCSCSGDNYEI